MSAFDYMTVHCELPIAHLRGFKFQTKDTPALFSNDYEIREDGTLWEQLYEIEDHSDPNAEGLDALAGILTRVNHRWEMCRHVDGELSFYHYITPKKYGGEHQKAKGDYIWVEFVAEFKAGRLVRPIELVSIEKESR